MTVNAAGILFVAPDKTALFIKRSSKATDCPDCWGFPGGMAEDDETPIETAKRECKEEIGFLPDGEMEYLTRQITDPTIPSSLPNAIYAGPQPAPPVDGPLPPTPLGAVNGQPLPIVTSSPNMVDFTTFLQKVDDQFKPKLNEEHSSYAWAPINNPPEFLHPGCRIALARMSMDELGIAQAIAAGQLTSPQQYHNIWLFAIRITGTDTAYRKALDEFAYRPPETYLTPEFLQRCNGLPVIWEHPASSTLDSKEFSDRVIGTVFIPFLGDGIKYPSDEVWAVAKIYDKDAAKLMTKNQMSTSPAVVFKEATNLRMDLPNGSTLLIEGKPSLLDHIAVCEQGVWDKGGKPTGVRTGETVMVDGVRADNEATEEIKKADAEAGEMLDKLLVSLDSLSERMDSFEKSEKMGDDDKEDTKKDEDEEDKKDEDGEDFVEEKKEARGDKRKDRKDGETEGEDFMKDAKRKDAKRKDDKEEDDCDDMRKDSSVDVDGRIQSAIDEVKKLIPRELSDEDHAKMADVQSRSDSVYAAFGLHAPRPLSGESLVDYKVRLANGLKSHGKFKDVDLRRIARADSSAFQIMEDQVYADAMQAAKNPVDLPDNAMRTVRRRDDTGRMFTEFYGQPRSWMSQFSGNRRRVSGGKFNTRSFPGSAA